LPSSAAKVPSRYCVALPAAAGALSAFAFQAGKKSARAEAVEDKSVMGELEKVTKYSLVNSIGRVTQAPTKPVALRWPKPTVCAPERATVSLSFRPILANFARKPEMLKPPAGRRREARQKGTEAASAPAAGGARSGVTA